MNLLFALRVFWQPKEITVASLVSCIFHLRVSHSGNHKGRKESGHIRISNWAPYYIHLGFLGSTLMLGKTRYIASIGVCQASPVHIGKHCFLNRNTFSIAYNSQSRNACWQMLMYIYIYIDNILHRKLARSTLFMVTCFSAYMVYHCTTFV